MIDRDNIIKAIHDNNLEIDIWRYLNKYVDQRLFKTIDELAEKRATISAISKINQNKNEAISALCE